MPIRPLAARPRRALALTATAALLVGGVGAAAVAATPAAGSVSDTAPSTQWTAGPFAAPNVTGTAGDVTCGPQLCDDYALHVSTPAGYGDTHQLTVKVGWGNAAADFDVYLLDHSGAVLASSASNSDPEVVVVPPTSGDYTVRVVPFAPLGESVTGTASLTDVPANPAPGTTTASPRRRSRGPTSRPRRPRAAPPAAPRRSTRSASPTRRPVASSRASSPARPPSCATPTTKARRGRRARAAASTPASTTRRSAGAPTLPTGSVHSR